MKIVQTKSYVMETEGEDFRNNQFYLGHYERDIYEMINEFLLDEQIRKEDLIDIKISTTSCVVDDFPYLTCTVLIIYEKEVEE